ncbi:hypothetical protein [Streptomyces solicathayae]|uniref:Lipoprotein n=1 Tax=Streptomyces solicathayae TaxID=3081768 RepID=A0ABZ0LUS7_9ACTN|nr:hypothetical protein [Streptomyces sp. HUAS YS2]WOX22956.1 hypothetical protein R2D22_16740 [Streptomyces sp. HUAS YS2]
MFSTQRSSAAVVGVAAAALVLTACSGGGKPAADRSGDPEPSAGRTSAPSSRATASPVPSAPTGPEGSWAGITDGKPVGLSIGRSHAVVIAAGQVCQGKLTDAVTLRLTCTDGANQRTEGTIESNDGKKLVVAWKSGTKDTLTEADPAPSGAASASASDAIELP